MVRAKEDDLIALAAQAGSKEAGTQAGVSHDPIFLGPGAKGINQDGDDPGFETRVKAPASTSRGRATKATATDKPVEKKTPGRPRGSASERSVEEIADAVGAKFDEFFTYISMGLPVTGTYGVENSDKAVKALISIGKRRPRVMQILAKMADGADGMDVARYVLGVSIAVQVDLGRIPADNIMARASGVTAIVEKYFVQEDDPTNPNVTGQATHATPRFQPVN